MVSKITLPLELLRKTFGERLQENVRLENYTTAHIGGIVGGLLIANNQEELTQFATDLWAMSVPFRILGNGSNVLVSDHGYQGVIIVNRARNMKIVTNEDPPSVWAESGANLGGLARQVALQGFSGMEWAAVIPGTVGGAVYGNAGAYDGDIQGSLLLADILHQKLGRNNWKSSQMQYSYRTSILKSQHQPAVILSARFALSPSTPALVQEKMRKFSVQRRASQPPGASMGSMFKNPPGDFAGRLIEAAGLKGLRIGGAEISKKHANFFINTEEATAQDIWELIQQCRNGVMDTFGVDLELEIETLGDWSASKDTPRGREE
ncbi:MAG: UDP-N-acetylmuramate dehydrogenase [Anaerolineaceae bacterium]|nr:UDP-N-acetylmuramate dehydrogenase [Anaerolineaceae bacterium]